MTLDQARELKVGDRLRRRELDCDGEWLESDWVVTMVDDQFVYGVFANSDTVSGPDDFDTALALDEMDTAEWLMVEKL